MDYLLWSYALITPDFRLEIFTEIFFFPNLCQVTKDLGESKMGNVEKVEPRKVIEVGFGMKKNEEQKLVKDVEEMKSKLNELELKLNEVSSLHDYLFIYVLPF